MKRWPCFAGLCLIAVVTLGCGPSGPSLYKVSGTVTWNGRPLADGVIIFSPVDGAVAPDSGKIVQGKYQFSTRAGSKRVEILATRDIPGKIDPVMKAPVREQYIPAIYNVNSTLTATVTPEGPNHWDYELRGKP
jgi:hypothetical protein